MDDPAGTLRCAGLVRVLSGGCWGLPTPMDMRRGRYDFDVGCLGGLTNNSARH